MQQEKQLKLSDKLRNMKGNSKWRCDVNMTISFISTLLLKTLIYTI